MKFKITEIIEFDEKEERQKIISYFNKVWQKRLLAILDNFEKGDYQKTYELYDKLPYCSVDECVGQEFVNPILVEILVKFTYANCKYGKTIEKVTT
jgi:hypothetical protein